MPWWPIQSPKRKESERLTGEVVEIKLINMRFERSKLPDSGKEGAKMFHKLHILRIKNDLWDRVGGWGRETWKGCECVELLMFIPRLRRTGTIPRLVS